MKGFDKMKISNLKLVKIFLWAILIVSYALIFKDYYVFLADTPAPAPINIFCSVLFFIDVVLLALLSNFKPSKLIVLQLFFALLIISYYIASFDLPDNIFTFLNAIFLYFSILPIVPLPKIIDISISALIFFLGIDAIITLCMILGHIHRKKHNK